MDEAALPRLSQCSPENKRKKLPSLHTLAEQKVDITKERFYLYVHQYFRSRSSERLADAMGQGRMITMSQLRADKSLEWLASKCARGEARKIAAFKDQQECEAKTRKESPQKTIGRSRGTAADSLILPSSSPLRAFEDGRRQKKQFQTLTDATSTKEGEKKVRAAWVENRKTQLFAWAIKRLREDGIIIVHLPDLSTPGCVRSERKASLDADATPKASRTQKNCNMHARAISALPTEQDANLPYGQQLKSATSNPCKPNARAPLACLCSSTSIVEKPPMVEESYALLTPTLLVPVLERIVSQLRARHSDLYDQSLQASCMQPGVSEVWAALRRDEMWRFVGREVVEEALRMSRCQQ